MIRAIIFDCFGVLMIDTLDAMVAPLQVSRPEVFARIRTAIEAKNRGQMSPQDFRRQVAGFFGLSVDEFAEKLAEGEAKNSEVLEFAGSLRPKFKTAMLSNVGSAGLERHFVPGELEKYFDVALASGDIGFAKPEPQAYEIAAERLGVPTAECVMIDDRAEYCAGAEAVGMRSIRFTTLGKLKRDLAVMLAG